MNLHSLKLTHMKQNGACLKIDLQIPSFFFAILKKLFDI